jgi:beta-aspartyl-peptidase (threonine type)
MSVIIIDGGAGKLLYEDEHRKGINEALQVGWKVLAHGGSALNAVISAIINIEDNPSFNCGTGSVLTIDGKTEMDASIMTDDGQFGAVGAIRQVKNPILVARKVMTETDHMLLVSDGAIRFARLMGFEKYEKIIQRSKDRLAKLKKEGRSIYFPKLKKYMKLGTVGAIALDNKKRIAVATSTGGINGRLSGRVGDSAILGAGTYADYNGGATATGHGEMIMKLFLSKLVVDLMKRYSAQQAINITLKQVRKEKALCGLIALDKKSNVGIGYTSKSMSWGYIKDNKINIF